VQTIKDLVWRKKKMLKIIKERTPETIIDRYIEFTYKDDPNAGFVFPALPNGEPDFENMPKEAILNYNNCLNDVRLDGPELRVDKRHYMNPAVGKCSCGAEVILDADYAGAVRCECGRWYNLFGQELRDPKYWEEDDEY
jgi:hypothetical protein